MSSLDEAKQPLLEPLRNQRKMAAVSGTPPDESASSLADGWRAAPPFALVLDSWDRNNVILLNLLHAVPEGGLAVRAMEGSPSIAELFTHIHYVRLVFVLEDAAECARALPENEWAAE